MPRARRHFLPNLVWHITHRCHKKQFLLRFARDRRQWVHWLYQARKRFGLSVLNYVVTSNHIHLLVHDRGRGEISRSMQLVAGRTAQAYNRRKNRGGAFWEDRYHATAVAADAHLVRCLTYVDLNMVRAGAVAHPVEWGEGGYHEIQRPPKRYRIVDVPTLTALLGMEQHELRRAHSAWVSAALAARRVTREALWSESVAVGSREFVGRVKQELHLDDKHHPVQERGSLFRLRESTPRYRAQIGAEMGALSARWGCDSGATYWAAMG